VRQGQQNRRGRGRNRKNHNPLQRSFESNGPDVKIRGTPAHIAEKYVSLARDAQSSGDPVLAENYLQHAEHYNRIIMAYREQLQQPGDMINGNGQRPRGLPEPGEADDEFASEEGDELVEETGVVPLPPQSHARHPSGHFEGQHHDRPFRRDRDQGRFRDRYHQERDRQSDNRQQPPFERQPESAAAEGGGEPRRRERIQAPQHEQPEFLRRPVRRARRDGNEGNSEPSSGGGNDEPPRD
jgi:Domain of unknown function (DUF4167)